MSRKKPALRNEQKLLNFLAERKKSISPLLILTHDFPDPDALASAYALQYIADRVYGIRSRITYKGIIGRVENRNMVSLLDLPVHRLRGGEINGYRHIALVDTQPEFENNPFPEDKVATLVIDQHPSIARPSAECAIVDTRCGATSTLMTKALLSLKVTIPERLATALAYGIITDTLNLYRAKSPDIIKTYLKILSFANMHILGRIQVPVNERRYFITLGHAIDQAQMYRGLIVCHIGRVSSPDVVSQTADFLLGYKQAKWTLATGRFRDKLHVSLRTKNMNVSAANILRRCVQNPEDAGGHDRIAGGSLKIGRHNDSEWKAREKELQDNIVTLLKLRRGGRFSRPFRDERS